MVLVKTISTLLVLPFFGVFSDIFCHDLAKWLSHYLYFFVLAHALQEPHFLAN